MIVEQTSLERAAAQVAERGAQVGLPHVAAWADLSSAKPALDAVGQPIPLLFEFTQTARDYWRQTDLALRNAVVTIVRHLSEPFYYSDGEIGSWRPITIDPRLTSRMRESNYNVRRSIVAPVHLARSVIGAVVWATDRDDTDVRSIFEKHSDQMYAEATRFIAACDETMNGPADVSPISLTRREIQCLKLVAAGKSDGDIAQIMGLTSPTVRFHLRNAGGKLGRSGRLRIAQRAASLGFVSIR